MKNRLGIVIVVLASLATLTACQEERPPQSPQSSPSPSSPAPTPTTGTCASPAPMTAPSGSAIPNQWIIELAPSATNPTSTANELAARYGLKVIAIYDALTPRGFAVKGPREAIERLRCDPNVTRITADAQAQVNG